MDVTGAGESGYRNFSSFFGASNIAVASSWFPTFIDELSLGLRRRYRGVETTNSALVSTSSFLTDPKVVFTVAGGSYLGDWDHSDDLIRAPLCTSTYGLGCIAKGPYEFFHTIALGDTVGAGAWLKQNYDRFLYQTIAGPMTCAKVASNGRSGSTGWGIRPCA